MAVMELSVNPIGTETASVSRYVARAIEVVREEKGVVYTVTSMGTIIEGPLPELLALVPKMHEAVFKAGVPRLLTLIKIDDRRDRPSTITGKMESIQRELGA